jgi:hypothetical protein
MTTITPVPAASGELAEARTMLAEARSLLADIVPIIAAARELGYHDCLAEQDGHETAARARQARASFRVIRGGLPEGMTA